MKAQRAVTNVLEHRIAKAVASDKTLMKKGSLKKHDIKTKYGFDRLVEDLIQESMAKGEFENLHGKGKPLKNQNINPYVDFTTHKLNEVNILYFSAHIFLIAFLASHKPLSLLIDQSYTLLSTCMSLFLKNIYTYVKPGLDLI